jgi:hypothetical protein
MDYQSNSRKSREENPLNRPEKQIVKVVTGDVVQKPKSIGRKFKDVFLGGDLKLTTSYVIGDVILPALRNLIVDMASEGSKRLVFGEGLHRRRPTTDYRSRFTYTNPLARDPRERTVTPTQVVHPWRQSSRVIGDIVLTSKEDAELVVENLIDIIDKYEVVSLGDLYDLLGQPTSHVDQKWGWTFLNNVEIRQIRDGYLIDLPPLEAI